MVTMKYRTHPFLVTVNRIRFVEVWIDPHYETSHGDTMTDALILALVWQLDGRIYNSQSESVNGYSFFVSDVCHNEKPYRLVWLTPSGNGYLGVRTAFRRSK